MIDEYYTTIFTPQELSAAASGLPVHLVSDDSVDEYELSHLPEGAWPPTSWYAEWVSGRASSISRVRNAHRDALARLSQTDLVGLFRAVVSIGTWPNSSCPASCR